jgi:hypothetical protein
MAFQNATISLDRPDNFRSVTISSDGFTPIAGSASNNGLWFSINGGQTWAQSINTTGDFRSVAISSDGFTAIAGSYFNTGYGFL